MRSQLLFIKFENAYIISRAKYASRIMGIYLNIYIEQTYKRIDIDAFKFNIDKLYRFNLYWNLNDDMPTIECDMDISLENKKIKDIYESLDTKIKKLDFIKFIETRKKEVEIDLQNLKKFISGETIDIPIYFIYRNPTNHFKSGLIEEASHFPTNGILSEDKHGINFKSILKTANSKFTDIEINVIYDTIFKNETFGDDKDISQIYLKTKSEFLKSLVLNKMITALNLLGYYHGHLGKHLSLYMPLINNNKNIKFINLDGEKSFNFENFFNSNFTFCQNIDAKIRNFSNKKKYELIDILFSDNKILDDFVNAYNSDIIWYNILKNDSRNIEY
jgi:hypothetical protein